MFGAVLRAAVCFVFSRARHHDCAWRYWYRDHERWRRSIDDVAQRHAEQRAAARSSARIDRYTRLLGDGAASTDRTRLREVELAS